MSSYAVPAPAAQGFRRGSSPARQNRSGAPTTRLLLTVRGRRLRAALIAVGAAGLLIAAVAGTPILIASPAMAAAGGSSVTFATVTVQPGESLWLVAQRVAPGADPREVIAELVLLNNLTGATVQAGESLALPAKYAR